MLIILVTIYWLTVYDRNDTTTEKTTMNFSLLQAIQWMGDGHTAGKLTDDEYTEVKALYRKVSHRELARQLKKKPTPEKTPSRSEVTRFNLLLRKCLS